MVSTSMMLSRDWNGVRFLFVDFNDSSVGSKSCGLWGIFKYHSRPCKGQAEMFEVLAESF